MKRVLLLLPLGACVINGGNEAPPVQLEVGTPTARAFVETVVDSSGTARGAVKHDVCVSADTPTGYIVPVELLDVGAMGPVGGAPLQTEPFADSGCPAAGLGWAMLEWDTTTGDARATLQHSATRGLEGDTEEAEPDGGFETIAFASGGTTVLTGEAFGGYDVYADEFEQVGEFTWAIPLHVEYRETETLTATPAVNVTVAMLFQPDASGYIVGGSPGVDLESGTFRTDATGSAYLLISDSLLCTDTVMFATTPDTGTTLVATMACF